jgi:hypothetical protein
MLGDLACIAGCVDEPGFGGSTGGIVGDGVDRASSVDRFNGADCDD